MNTSIKSTCIIGIGNSLRSDDGAGAYICSLLEEKKLPVTIITTHQLDIGMVEELSKFDRVIFVDAAANETQFSFQLLNTLSQQLQSSSHHINTAMLASLAKQLFAAPTQFYLCAVGASHFEMGSSLSEKTKYNATEAAAMLSKWIQSNC
jgi:hydrogenase maturation protease